MVPKRYSLFKDKGNMGTLTLFANKTSKGNWELVWGTNYFALNLGSDPGLNFAGFPAGLF